MILTSDFVVTSPLRRTSPWLIATNKVPTTKLTFAARRQTGLSQAIFSQERIDGNFSEITERQVYIADAEDPAP